jgi:triphosphoribosyl-dephospho-CoA synthase
MTALLSEDELRRAFLTACRTELAALKAGNVHIHAAGHGMQVADFEAAAEAAAPFVADPRFRLGERILRAVDASFAATGCNTNLGILLLCVPLAAAATIPAPAGRDLRTRLSGALDATDRHDARDVYRAIARANPGGLGRAPAEDVAQIPTVTLQQAMALAAGRDRIANAYVTGYADVFEVALPCLAHARDVERDEPDAVAHLHLSLMARFPDSHISRKYGPQRAEEIRRLAEVLAGRILPLTSIGHHERLLAFDTELKNDNINPGTTADFVVASLFADTIIRRGRYTAAV